MLGILNAYHFDKDPNTYQKEYAPMCVEYFHKIMPDTPVKVFQVAMGEFPSSPDECDGWVITGSPASAYDEADWIRKLESFIRECHQKKAKLLGICFGHQILAKALGGEVVKSEKGWGVGVRSFNITANATWMNVAKLDHCNLIFSHQDQVSKLPAGAKVLATDSFCPNQIFSIDNHIFSMQGHPEFTKKYAQTRYGARQDILGQSTYDKAMQTINNETDEMKVGLWIKEFFKQNY